MEIDSITIKNIRVFIAVVEKGDVKNAADYLGITTSTVYSHIKWLEEKLLVKLFWRKINIEHLTKQGQGFYQIALELVSILDNKIRKLHDEWLCEQSQHRYHF